MASRCHRPQAAQRTPARICEARPAKGLSQKQLADLLPGTAVDGRYVSGWEHDVHLPTMRYMRAGPRARRQRRVADGARPRIQIAPPVPSADRQIFYAALAELARRHAGQSVPRGPDLTVCELCVYSQNGEDGMIAEIVRQIGPVRREFVEFGAERGVEGNCVALADLFGWSGLFIEADENKADSLAWKYRDRPDVQTVRARVTPKTSTSCL